MIGYAHGRAGHGEEAAAAKDEILRRLKTRKVSPFTVALAHAAVGDSDRAFVWLEKAYEERDPEVRYLGTEVWFSHLSGDPRFQGLVRRIGLVPPK